jgi:molecular chaperone HscB
MGGDDPDVRAQLEGERIKFTKMLDEAQQELESHWTKWDSAVDAQNDAGKSAAKDAMVALLNRRSYIRNLVRDVNAALDN